jgi:hypothetical protein
VDVPYDWFSANRTNVELAYRLTGGECANAAPTTGSRRGEADRALYQELIAVAVQVSLTGASTSVIDQEYELMPIDNGGNAATGVSTIGLLRPERVDLYAGTAFTAYVHAHTDVPVDEMRVVCVPKTGITLLSVNNITGSPWSVYRNSTTLITLRYTDTTSNETR